MLILILMSLISAVLVTALPAMAEVSSENVDNPQSCPHGQMMPDMKGCPPDHMMPEHMKPGQMMPGQMMPGQMMPGQMMPGQMMPGQMMPGHMMVCPSMGDHIGNVMVVMG